MPLPNLTDEFIADAYTGFLHTSNTPIVGNDPVVMYDGLGNKTALSIGAETKGIKISGKLEADTISVVGFNNIIDFLYPVDSLYLTATSVNPQTRFSGTTWTLVSQGRFLVGVGNGTDDNTSSRSFTEGNNSGEYTVALTVGQIPEHNHLNGVRTEALTNSTQHPHIYGASRQDMDENRTSSNPDASYFSADAVGSFSSTNRQGFTSRTGGGNAHNNTPPSFGVYVWRRLS
jgi:hypothetical protein